MARFTTAGGSGSGAPGPQGPQGPAGDSAYDIAVENGFVGTEQEWLDSIGGGTDNHGDFYFDQTTLRVDSSSDMILEANEGDGSVASQIKIGNGDVPINIVAYETDESSYGTGDWSTAEWQSDGNGAGQIVLTGITSIEQHLNNFNYDFQKVLIDDTTLVAYNGASYGGGNATIYVSEGPSGGTTATVLALRFIQSIGSGITIDYDDDEMNIVANNMQLNIDSTGNEDININASDDLRLESGDDMFLRSNGYINFVSSNNDNNYEWRMESNGTLEFPARGRLRNPSSSSGDGNGYDTFHIIPDFSRYEYDQYLIVDPTQPNHIHIRAGGTQDESLAELILGGEENNVAVNDSTDSVTIKTKRSDSSWTYQNVNSGGTTFIVNLENSEPDYGDFIIDNNIRYNINYVFRNLETYSTEYTAISQDGTLLEFSPWTFYTFFRDNGLSYWQFDSQGYLSGPAMGNVNVYGITNPSTSTYLGIYSSHKISINGTDGEFLGDAEVADNQIATIGDVLEAQGSGANGEVTRWSPNFQATGLSFTGANATYPTYNSHYVKNGRIVSFWIEIDLATVTNFGTGQYITALPYAPLTGTMNHFQAWANVDPTINPDIAGHVVLQADHLANTTALDLHYLKQAGGANSPLMEAMFTQGAPATLTTSSKIYINGTYITAE